jgi:hypothetical protein
MGGLRAFLLSLQVYDKARVRTQRLKLEEAFWKSPSLAMVGPDNATITAYPPECRGCLTEPPIPLHPPVSSLCLVRCQYTGGPDSQP